MVDVCPGLRFSGGATRIEKSAMSVMKSVPKTTWREGWVPSQLRLSSSSG